MFQKTGVNTARTLYVSVQISVMDADPYLTLVRYQLSCSIEVPGTIISQFPFTVASAVTVLNLRNRFQFEQKTKLVDLTLEGNRPTFVLSHIEPDKYSLGTVRTVPTTLRTYRGYRGTGTVGLVR